MRDGDAPKANKVTLRVWRGLMSNVDPHDLPAGATIEQTNVTNIKPGLLAVREGLREVSFD